MVCPLFRIYDSILEHADLQVKSLINDRTIDPDAIEHSVGQQIKRSM